MTECFRNDNGVKGGILTRNIISGLPRILFLLTDGKPNYKYTASPPQCPCNVNSRDPAVCQPKVQGGLLQMEIRTYPSCADSMSLMIRQVLLLHPGMFSSSIVQSQNHDTIILALRLASTHDVMMMACTLSP